MLIWTIFHYKWKKLIYTFFYHNIKPLFAKWEYLGIRKNSIIIIKFIVSLNLSKLTKKFESVHKDENLKLKEKYL